MPPSEPLASGDSLDLYCHGSLRYQATTTVVDGAGVDTGVSRYSLTCDNGQFVSSSDQVSISITSL